MEIVLNNLTDIILVIMAVLTIGLTAMFTLGKDEGDSDNE